MISKKRIVILNEAPVPEYHMAKRVGPSLPPISIDCVYSESIFLNHLVRSKKGLIDLAMTMINMHRESENQRNPPISSWTGFNILL